MTDNYKNDNKPLHSGENQNLPTLRDSGFRRRMTVLTGMTEVSGMTTRQEFS